jgi:hypothetical protein
LDEKIMHRGLAVKPEGTNHLEELGVDGSSEIKWEGVDWIHLAQDRDEQWALWNTV